MPSIPTAVPGLPLDTRSSSGLVSNAGRRQIRRMQYGVLTFFVVDALLLTGYGAIGVVPKSVGWLYGTVGCALACGMFGWFWLRGAQNRDLGTVVLMQTLIAAAIMLAMLVAAPEVGGMMLMSLMAVVALSALQLSGRQIVALCLAIPLLASCIVATTGVQLRIPTHDVIETTLTAVWFAWLMGKCAAHNLAGTALRAMVGEANVELNAALRTVERLAAIDDLTGLPNRRSILAALDLALAPQRRRSGEAESVAAAMVDLDRFKEVNDRFGHGVGDEVLRAFGGLAAASARPGDRIGRYGGEEFLIVLGDIRDVADAVRAAERLRMVVEGHDWSAIVAGMRTTVSIGVAMVTAGEDAAAAIRRADIALYQAKRLGRNRVEVA